eukprot:TRINITY_DN3168_c0_g1_i3.p1 TRINITY_DN3168_c0_g1~~TRINITY_DN3168_c0_g1_i3.p1  ORF type:complete len:343 (-),score=50.92 TRINITY_DN3168_c0_g1_i3:9-1037(-)
MRLSVAEIGKGLDSKQLGALRLGTAGFSNAHWSGKFYPSNAKKTDSQLECFQETFYAVEVNTSFYGTPSADTIANWKRCAAEGFQLGLKVPKTVTHGGSLVSDTAIESLRYFLDRIEALGSNLGPILFQCPRSLRADASALKRLQRELGSRTLRIRVAFEFRNSSWMSDQEVLSIFRENNWALAQHPNTMGRATAGGGADVASAETYDLEPLRDEATADFVYVRLHGNNDTHTYRYSDEELGSYANQLHTWRTKGLDVYCMILSDDAEAAMPQNAKRLMELTYALANEAVPKGPKMTKQRSISSFFGAKPAAAKASEPPPKRLKSEDSSRTTALGTLDAWRK